MMHDFRTAERVECRNMDAVREAKAQQRQGKTQLVEPNLSPCPFSMLYCCDPTSIGRELKQPRYRIPLPSKAPLLTDFVSKDGSGRMD